MAGVIAGPPLPFGDFGYSVTGVGFTATADTTLTRFTFQSQGKPDTVVLTNGAGDILYSQVTPAAARSDTENVNWAITAGSTYWLFQTVRDNARDDYYNKPLPSDSEITITDSGTFDTTILAAISLHNFPQTNLYWASFNDITTTTVAPPPTPTVPEPGSWAMMLLGFVAVGTAARGRRVSSSRGTSPVHPDRPVRAGSR